MIRKFSVLAIAAFVFLVLSSGGKLFAQNPPDVPADAEQVTITARVSHGTVPKLTREDVSVHEDRHPRQVLSLTPLDGSDSPMQLVILIDSNSTPRIGAQFNDISTFIQALPQNAGIALAYAANGSARIEQGFTTDRAAITKALHIPIGPAAGNTSIYAAFSDLVRKWPGNDGQPREVLLISDGIDPTYGLFNTQPQLNPGLEEAIRDAQRNRVIVFSIFASSGRATRNGFLNLNGQGSLSELTSNTGGYSFFQGTETPVSFSPFLDDLQRLLSAQYLLTFRAAPASPSRFHDLKVTTEMSGVKLLAPSKIYIPASR